MNSTTQNKARLVVTVDSDRAAAGRRALTAGACCQRGINFNRRHGSASPGRVIVGQASVTDPDDRASEPEPPVTRRRAPASHRLRAESPAQLLELEALDSEVDHKYSDSGR